VIALSKRIEELTEQNRQLFDGDMRTQLLREKDLEISRLKVEVQSLREEISRLKTGSAVEAQYAILRSAGVT
jgi:hypothetical protein